MKTVFLPAAPLVTLAVLDGQLPDTNWSSETREAELLEERKDTGGQPGDWSGPFFVGLCHNCTEPALLQNTWFQDIVVDRQPTSSQEEQAAQAVLLSTGKWEFWKEAAVANDVDPGLLYPAWQAANAPERW